MFIQIIELYHAQITAYQNELLAIQRQIDLAMTANKQRRELLICVPDTTPSELEFIQAQLETLPETSPASLVGMLEAKSRVRERMAKVIGDLARLQCVGGATRDWRNALNTLLGRQSNPSTTG